MSSATDLRIAKPFASSSVINNETTQLTQIGASPSPASRAQANDTRGEPARLSYRIDEVCRLTGLGRTTIYAAVKSGALKAWKCGRCNIVLHDDLLAFLRNLPKAKASSCVRSTSEQRGGGDE